MEVTECEDSKQYCPFLRLPDVEAHVRITVGHGRFRQIRVRVRRTDARKQTRIMYGFFGLLESRIAGCCE